MNNGAVLIVDDEINICINLSKFISKLGFLSIIASNVTDAKQKLKENNIKIIISDIIMPGEDGIEFLKFVKEKYPETKVILITAYTTVELTLKAIKYKVDAFLEKPISFDELEKELLNFENQVSIKAPVTEIQPQKIKFIKKHNIVMSPLSPMNELVNFLELVSDKKASVFIYGESGTGKELVARALHNLSKRQTKPFVAINCGAIPETLIESELFGYTKGSFTGAISDRAGRIELADNGTLFLDEIGELSLNMQVKFLRVLQEKSVTPIGAKLSKNIDFRLVSATNIDLETYVIDKKFREDLFYRINVIPIKIPPLRERKEDIPALIEYFIEENIKNQQTTLKGVTKDAMDYLINYSWPGNVRELQNLIERLSIIKDEGFIEVKDLPDKILNNANMNSSAIPSFFYTHTDIEFDFKEMVESYQKELLIYGLKKAGGNKKKAADFLKLKRTTLVEMLKRLNIDFSDDDE